MGIAANVQCFYVDQGHRVVSAVTLSEESRDGYVMIKNAPDWRPHSVISINVFMTEGAAQRAAVSRAAKSSGKPPAPGTFVR